MSTESQDFDHRPDPPAETGLEGGEMYTSMRTRTIVAMVVVGAMVPAGTAVAGFEGPGTNALVASHQSTGPDGSGAQSSVNALVGDGTSEAAPAPASERPPTSLNALVGADSEQSPSQPANTTTLTALVGADSEPSQPANTSTLNALVGADSEPHPSQPANTSTLNALVGAEPQSSPRQSSPAGADYASVGAIVGDQTPSPSPVASSPDDGFDWTDALFGALAAFGLTALMIVAARSVIRHRRPVAASRA
jgi:hypothetical protein